MNIPGYNTSILFSWKSRKVRSLSSFHHRP